MWPYMIGLTLVQLLAFILFARVISKKTNARQKSTSIQVREAKLIEIYDRLEGLMDSFEDYIGEVRADIDDKRAEVNDLARQVGVLYARMDEASRTRTRAMEPTVGGNPEVSDAAKAIHAPQPTPPALSKPEEAPPPAAKPERAPPSRLSKRDRAALDRFATKPQKIRFLMSLGMSLEEVAREMDIGKGEVRLIADLEK